MAHEDQAPHYVAEAWQCLSCAAKERAARDDREANKGHPPPGFYYAVKPQVNGRSG